MVAVRRPRASSAFCHGLDSRGKPKAPAPKVLAFTLICFGLLVAQAVAWPFKSHICNCIETIFLFALACITALSGPDVTSSRDFAIQIVLFLQVGGLLITWLVLEISRQQADRLGIESFSDSAGSGDFQSPTRPPSMEDISEFNESDLSSSISILLRERLLTDSPGNLQESVGARF